MKHYLGPVLAVALAVPSLALADEPRGEHGQAESRTQAGYERDARTDRQQVQRQTAEQQREQQQQAAQYGQETQQERRQTELRSHVLPAMASIESAQISAAALHELASAGPFNPQIAQRNVELADQALRVGNEQIEALRNVEGLSQEERTQVQRATEHLMDAQSTAQRLQQQVDGDQAVQQQQAEEVRYQSERLHTQLADARTAIEGIAGNYQISTQLRLHEETARG